MLAVVKFIYNQDSGKKSNFIFSDFGILLVSLQYRSKIVKNAKRICVAICFGSSKLTGLFVRIVTNNLATQERIAITLSLIGLSKVSLYELAKGMLSSS